MKQFMKRHDIWLRLLSLALAVVIWAVVMNVENPERPYDYENIAVTVIGQNELQQNTGMSVVSGLDHVITVRLKGRSSDVTVLRNRITVTVDVSGLTEPGEYDLPYTVSVGKSGIEVVSPGRTDSAHVRVDMVTTKVVPVKAAATGNAKEGYRYGKPVPTTEKVTVEGPQTDLNEVAYASVTVNAEGASSTVQQDCLVDLRNEAGAAVTSPYVKSKTETIQVTLPVYQNSTIPLTVTLKDGGTIKADQARATINPESIQVYGDEKTLSEIKEISLGEIDLGSVKTGSAITRPIELPEGLSFVENEPTTASVTISVDGVDTRMVEVTSFVTTDTSEGKSGITSTVETEMVEIELRGKKSVLDQVDANIFSIGLTIDSASLGAGTHMVKGVVVATGLPSGVTLVDEDVQVVLKLEAVGATE